MAIKTHETELNGFTFYVTEFPARKGLKIWYRVVKAVGPSLLQLASVDGSADVSALSGAITGLFENMSEAEFDTLCTDLLYDVNVKSPVSEVPEHEGKILGLIQGVGCFDTVFTGRYLMLFKLLRFVLEVNYGDFIGALTQNKQ